MEPVRLHVAGGGELGSVSHSPTLGERLALGEQEMVVVEVVYAGAPPVLVSAGLKQVARGPAEMGRGRES